MGDKVDGHGDADDGSDEHACWRGGGHVRGVEGKVERAT
jgi:hypothetical protein